MLGGVFGFVVLALFTSSRLFYVLLFCMVVVSMLFPRVPCIVFCFCACVRCVSFHVSYGMRDLNAHVLCVSLGGVVCCVFFR